MNELTIERMYELEKMVKDNNIIYPLSLVEFRYVERASKMSYNDAKEDLRCLEEIILPFGQITYIYSLLVKYNCNEKELKQRLEDVSRVMKYENIICSNLLKEQKRMIKRMNNRW